MYENMIENFHPYSPQEEKDKKRVLQYIKRYGDILLSREQTFIHFTSSAFIINPELTKVLLIHHHIYQAFCWTGGHVDGEKNFLSVAIKEAKEETNLQQLYPLTTTPISLDILPVIGHMKNGRWVDEHHHINTTYPMIAEESWAISPNLKENSKVQWIPIKDLQSYCKEPLIYPIYLKLINFITHNYTIKKRITLFSIVPLLLQWFDKHKRDLPWRQEKNPYSIWVSEIMLQQTRVEAVKNYYIRFMNHLPRIEDLANVEDDVLLKLWQGLGYYNRAKNLKKAASIIVSDYHGDFPTTYEDILSLPGIGEYTAGSVSSIAFGLPYAAVDGNVIRVISRLLALDGDSTATVFKKTLKADLESIYPIHDAGNFTESLMELGATICIPKGAPLCCQCPISHLCISFNEGTMDQYPQKPQKKERKQVDRTILLIQQEDKIILQKRPKTGLLSNLWEFINLDGEKTIEEVKSFVSEQGLEVTEIHSLSETKHIFTHLQWNMKGYHIFCKNIQCKKDIQWAKREELLHHYPIPSAYSHYLNYIKDKL